MNKELCQEVQTTLLTLEGRSESLSDELREHLHACQECQDFQRVLTLLEDTPRPSATLEEKTRRLCHQALASRRQARWRKYFLWTSAAAALLLLAGTLLPHLSQRPAPGIPATLASTHPVVTAPANGEPWEDLMLDTEFSLANEDLSSLELQLDFLVVDLL